MYSQTSKNFHNAVADPVEIHFCFMIGLSINPAQESRNGSEIQMWDVLRSPEYVPEIRDILVEK